MLDIYCVIIIVLMNALWNLCIIVHLILKIMLQKSLLHLHFMVRNQVSKTLNDLPKSS